MFPPTCRCFCTVLCLAALSVCATAHNSSAPTGQHVSGTAASSMAPQPPALPGKGMQRFLAVPMPGSKSHYLQVAAIVKELASRGHHVKVVCTTTDAAVMLPFVGLDNNPNVSTAAFNPKVDFEAIREKGRIARSKPNPAVEIMKMVGFVSLAGDLLSNMPLLQELKDFQADLVLTDYPFAAGEALADLLSLPRAAMTIIVPAYPLQHAIFDLSRLPAGSIPTFGSALPVNMTLRQRVKNWLLGQVQMLFFKLSVLPRMKSESCWKQLSEMDVNWFQWHLKVYVQADAFGIEKSYRVPCPVLIHDDWAVAATPYHLHPRAVVTGPLTAEAPRPLPADMEAFVQSAGEAGFVFASLGVTGLAEVHELKAIRDALAAIAPTKAIWKLHPTDLKSLEERNVSLDIPASVMVTHFAPQNSLLGHPKLRAFLTQAGTNSFLEAAWHGKPIVGVPLMIEQPDNLARAEEQGWGLRVNFRQLAKEPHLVHEALARVLREPSFARAAQHKSVLMQAHSRSPRQRAADALEHASWTGCPHLQRPPRDQHWFTRSMWDLYLTLAGIASAAAAAIFVLGKQSVRLLARYLPALYHKIANVHIKTA